jgi:hypothetical protein
MGWDEADEISFEEALISAYNKADEKTKKAICALLDL